MKYLTIRTFRPEHRDAVVQRFGETGGQPPDGVTMLTRLHDVSGGRGFAVSESDDPVAMATWTRQWADIMSFEIVPVIDDEQLVQALGG